MVMSTERNLFMSNIYMYILIIVKKAGYNKKKLKRGWFPSLPSAPTWQRGEGRRQRGESASSFSPLCRMPPHGKGGKADGKGRRPAVNT